MHAGLLTTQTVIDETEKFDHKMSDSFIKILTDGVVEVVDDVATNHMIAEIEALSIDYNDGESSLIKFIVNDNETSGKSILITNDSKAFKQSVELGIDTILITDYLILLEKEKLVACDDALIALENMLAKRLSKHRHMC